MIKILDKKKCCGCTACFSACPKHCISMKPDSEGFLYPEVNMGECIDCGICTSVCPVLNPIIVDEKPVSTYAIRSRDKDNLMESTSGGFFLPLAKWILEKEGGICAAAYDHDYTVVHKILTPNMLGMDEDTVYFQFRGSKYVQSNLSDCFVVVRELLKNEKFVCFIGTPCQVQGLKKYIGKNNLNLITVDLVCHGVPSPKLWKNYIDYQTQKYNSPIKKIQFRSKRYGYHSGGIMNITFENDRIYHGSARTDYMLKAFFKEISSRPICYNCPFKTLNRCSDITLYDCWHYTELTNGKLDDDCGYTNVIVQSDMGDSILSEIENSITIVEVDTIQAQSKDGKMILSSTKPHPKRDVFYEKMNEIGIRKTIKHFIPIECKDYIIEASKSVLYKTGFLWKIKEAKNRCIIRSGMMNDENTI